jgi:hypothetical protein
MIVYIKKQSKGLIGLQRIQEDLAVDSFGPQQVYGVQE